MALTATGTRFHVKRPVITDAVSASAIDHGSGSDGAVVATTRQKVR